MIHVCDSVETSFQSSYLAIANAHMVTYRNSIIIDMCMQIQIDIFLRTVIQNSLKVKIL